MRDQCSESSFLKDVQHHQMTVIRDDGVHRHIRFGKPGTGCMHFQLITWPGYLCYTGDMGTYVFRRLEDMFEFFRHRPRDDGRLYINESYWAEKLEATDKNGGHRAYSPSRFRAYVIDHCKEWRREMSRSEFKEFREAIEEDVLRWEDEGEHEAHKALYEFGHGDRRWFQDSWEADFKEYTFRFTWCCYALAWGIGRYDEQRSKLTASALGRQVDIEELVEATKAAKGPS